MDDATKAGPVFLTVAQFCDKHSWAKPGGIRHAIFFGENNGFEACTARFGRKLLLDEAKVLEWLRSGRAAHLSPTLDSKARGRRGPLSVVP